jgi:lysophospholipase L1-like esterase
MVWYNRHYLDSSPPGNTNMKTIVCYGDSNTWGYNPTSGGRYAPDERWPGVMRAALGEGYTVIEEGLNGRTTVWDDPFEPGCNGKTYFLPCLLTHHPLDLVIILLGTNDLKHRFGLSAHDIARGVGTLVSIAQASDTGPEDGPPPVLMVAPPPVARLTDFALDFEGAEEKSRAFGRAYRLLAEELDCAFLDAGDVVISSDRDGIHLDVDQQATLGRALAEKVVELLG